jgi:hypothetical protein
MAKDLQMEAADRISLRVEVEAELSSIVCKAGLDRKRALEDPGTNVEHSAP